MSPSPTKTSLEATIWPPPAYNGKVRFDVWETQLEMYTDAKKITDDKEKGVQLLQHIGLEMLEKIIDWTNPDKPKDLGYKKLAELITNQCATGPNLFARRVKLFNEKQQSNQSVQEYFAHMNQLLGQCQMKEMTPQQYGVLAILRGLESDELRQFLMNPTNDVSTLEKARTLAVSFEQSRIGAKEISGRGQAAPHSLNVVGKGYKCKWCGEVHQPGKEKCPANGKVCKKCGKKDHFSKVCKSGRKQNFVEDCSEALNGLYPHSVLTVSSKQEDVPPSYVNAKLNGATVRLQHDTGAAVTVINKGVWYAIGKPKIHPCSLELQSYNQHIPVIGQCKIIVQVGMQIKQQWVVIVPKGKCLFGRNWMKAFDMYEPYIQVKNRQLGEQVCKQNTVSLVNPVDYHASKPLNKTFFSKSKVTSSELLHAPMQGKEKKWCANGKKQGDTRFLNQKAESKFSRDTVLRNFKSQKGKFSKLSLEAPESKALKFKAHGINRIDHTIKSRMLKTMDTVAGSESNSLREGVMDSLNR